MCIFGSFIVFEQVWSPYDIVIRTSPCDTSIEGTQDLVLEKCSHNHCICYL